jgi:hypothetical protein
VAEANQNQEAERLPSNATGNELTLRSREEKDGARRQTNHAAATGPRTEVGKRTSSKNAVKFGIFSQATLLKNESQTDYKRLLDGLWDALQPEGKLEELLVEKLAIISWRYQRFLVAESAEIRKKTEFSELIGQAQQTGSTVGLSQYNPLISRLNNFDDFELCTGLLDELRQNIKTNGFNESHDSRILKTIYGDPDNAHTGRTLQDEYVAWLLTAQLTEEVRAREQCSSPEQCKQIILREIGTEIKRIKQDQQNQESMKSEQKKVEILRQNVPDHGVLARLLRYETSLERAFDRTLTQLERLQRMRRGQPLPPQLDIKIS